VYTQAKDRMYFGTGHKVDDYAMKNENEYFAELTSGFFGANSSGKITKEWLKENDPEGYRMIVKYYKVKENEVKKKK
jgi:Mlc titration factor MtfA (ptsG expression regulator)